VRCSLPWLLGPALAALIACGSPDAPAVDSAPDTILVNGTILTIDGEFAVAEALALGDGRILSVGSTADIEALAGPDTGRLDLLGRTALPGFGDGHFHSAGGGPGVDLSSARSLDDVLQAVARRVGEAPAGEIVMSNSDWHEAQLVEQRLPLRRDLDTVAPDTPVVLVRGGHEYILNSAALALWGIDERTPVPDGGRISRYPDGAINGELVDTAKALAVLPQAPAKTDDEWITDFLAQQARLHEAGLTSIRLGSARIEDYRLLQEIHRRGQLALRMSVLLRLDGNADPAEVEATLDRWGVTPGEGDAMLRVDGIKLGVDGGFEGGYFREPYEEPWGEGGEYYGLRTVDPERFVEVVRTLNRRGWRVGTHAVGDAAIDLVLDAYEAAHADQPITGRRWALEHGFVVAPDQLPRLAGLDLVISAQHHLYLAGPSLVKYWGRERAELVTPVRTYLDHGFVVAGGSDSPVAPFPPLGTLYHFVTRDTITGGVMGAGEGVTVEEALRISTRNTAYLSFAEADRGTLEPGKLADLIVLDRNPLDVAPAELNTLQVGMTMVDGRIVHAR